MDTVLYVSSVYCMCTVYYENYQFSVNTVVGINVTDSHSMFTEPLLCTGSWDFGVKKTHKILALMELLFELREINNKQVNR